MHEWTSVPSINVLKPLHILYLLNNTYGYLVQHTVAQCFMDQGMVSLRLILVSVQLKGFSSQTISYVYNTLDTVLLSYICVKTNKVKKEWYLMRQGNKL